MIGEQYTDEQRSTCLLVELTRGELTRRKEIAAKGEPSAAKFIKEINREGASQNE